MERIIHSGNHRRADGTVSTVVYDAKERSDPVWGAADIDGDHAWCGED